MSKATFLPDNKILTANLSMITGTVNQQFPLTNLQHVFSTKVFRSVEDTVEILIDLQQANSIDYVCLRGSVTDGLGITSASIIGSATTVFSGTPIDIELSHKYNIGHKQLTGSFRYWKLVLTGVAYCELSNIYLGSMVQMDDNNISQGFSYSLNTNSSVQKNQIGQKFIDTYGKQKLLSGDIKYANSVEFEQINQIHEDLGENIPLWFILDNQDDMAIQDSKFKFSGMFYMKDLVWKQSAYNLFDCQLSLEEAM